MHTVRLTVAQALVQFLDSQYILMDGKESKFVRGIMGIFGHGNVTGLGEAIENHRGDLEFIQGKNEQGMAHAAIAFAKQMNRRAIYACTSSIGPGALNMVTAAGTATVNRIPVLFLPGDVFACRQPDPVLQQIEHAHDYTITANDAFRPVSKYWDRINRPEQLMPALLNAMRVLTDPAETGAVTLALPQDVQAEAYDWPVEFLAKRVHVIDRLRPAESSLSIAVDMIVKKRKPLLIVGGGVRYSEAGEAVEAFASAFHIPIAETQAGKGAIVSDFPFNLGAVGVNGSAAANRLAREADLVIGVGTRFTDFTTSSKTAFSNPNVQFLSINVSRADAYKLQAFPLIGDAQATLIELQTALAAQGYQSEHSLSDLARLKQKWQDEVTRLVASSQPEGLTQTQVIGEVNRHIDETAVIVCAAGSLPGDLHRLWHTKSPGTYHMEYGFSCMGYEVSGAFGIKLATPDRDVYALVGDGSYLMLHSELVTSIQERKKIIIVLFDNHGFQCIHSLQCSQGSKGFGNEFRYKEAKTRRLTGEYLPIDFAAHARSLGAAAFQVHTVEELRRALEASRYTDVTTLIDVKVVPRSGSPQYDSWWRLGVAETSCDEDVQAAAVRMKEMVKSARPI
jgi:3D-(3,5/4)-trihydroxycyclohexane-1,2-dione acylhydrolase (decyclizing)